MSEKLCARCGKVVRSERRKYCPECAAAVRREGWTAANRKRLAAIAASRPEKRCARCGAVIPSRRTYCQECAKAVNRERAKENNSALVERRKLERAKHPRPCTCCGAPMEKYQKLYCRACADAVTHRSKPKAGDGGRPMTAPADAAEEDGRQVAAPADACKDGGQQVAAPAGACKDGGQQVAASAGAAEDGGRPMTAPAGALEEAKRRVRRRLRLTGDQIAALATRYDVPYNSYGKLRAYVDEHDALPPERFLRRFHPDPMMRPEDREQYERAWARRGGPPGIVGSRWDDTQRQLKPRRNGRDETEDI